VPKLKWTRHRDLAINTRPCVDREEYLAYMTFQANERPLLTEIFGPMVGLKEEWEEQGASPAELDFSAFRYRAPLINVVPVKCGWIGGRETELIEDSDEFLIYRDAMGRTMKLQKGRATLALPMDFPVKTMDDWLAVKPHYAFNKDRLAGNWAERMQKQHAAGYAIMAFVPGAFAEPRELMGDEELCVAYYDNPELIHDMLDTFADTSVRVLERVTSQVPVDILHVHEDMAGKSGPLAGPRQVEEFFTPYYRRIWDMMRERGTTLFSVDSDGNMNAVVGPLLEAGVNVLKPLEPAAEMDIVQLRRTYGTRLAFEGGIDKHVIRRSREEIVAELEYKLPPIIASGGCVFGLDHRVPDGTPLTNYRFYLDKVWEIFERETS